MELTVRPDDLASSAAALRQAHDALGAARADFSALALRLVPQLGPHAADSARATLACAAQGCELVEADIATFGQGLAAAAAYYAALDPHALGRFTVAR